MGFLNGIYGFDFLSIFLLLISSVLNFWYPARILGTIIFFIVVYRTFSRNIYRRKDENYRFRLWTNKFLGKLGLSLPDNLQNLNSRNLSMLLSRLRHRIDEVRKYKMIICPGCRKKLKLPRGRGKVIITCRTCKTEFRAKV